METTYTITAAGVEEFGTCTGLALFPDYAESPAPREPAHEAGRSNRIDNPVTVLDAPERSEPPPGERPRRHYSERQRRLRALDITRYAREHYLRRDNTLGESAAEDVDGCLSHVSRFRGAVEMKQLNAELLEDFRDYFHDLLEQEEIMPRTANKHLAILRAIGNHASNKNRRMIRPITFKNYFPEPEPDPIAWGPDEYHRIEAASRAVTGSVGTAKRDGYSIAADKWWFAWWRTISRAGCRLSALMLAERGDYENGVLWLRRKNQKQKKDQKFLLPARTRSAIEELLAAHDQAKLFPWPFDKKRPGKKTNWKTLYGHFRKKLLGPCGIELPKGVLTRMARRSAATMVEDNGGDGQELCGHKSRSTTEKHYIPHSRVKINRNPLLIPEGDQQLKLFQTGEAG